MKRLVVLMVAAGGLGLSAACSGLERNEAMTVRHINPEGMHRNPAFTQAIAVEGPHRVVYVGGQNAVDADGNIVGSGDLAAQTEQAYRNIETALAGAGAGLEHIVKTHVYIVHGQDPRPGFAASQRIWADRGNPPTICVLFVSGLAHPEFLIEIDATAVVPR